MKKIICLVLCAAMIFCMTGWTTGNIWTADAFDTEISSSYPKTDKVISSNSKYELVWKAETCTVDLIEKATGNRWGVSTPGTYNEITGMMSAPKPEAASTLVIEVLDKSNNNVSEYFSSVAAVKNGRVVTEDIQNGIRIYYYFDDLEIRVAIDFVLRENSVAVTVDPKLIQENKGYTIVSARIASFWCYNVNDSEDSYLFYPSGSGTLVSNKSYSSAGVKLESQVYGYDAAMIRDNYYTTEKSVRVPVYGAKNGNIATCAIIEKNAESAVIGVKTGSTALGNSAVYAKLQLRPYSDNYTQQMNNKQERQQVYSVSMAETPITVGFYPLTGEDANYSGMAKTYKDYLKSTGSLSEKVTEESALNLTMLGGVMVTKSFLGVPYDDLVAATTVTEAQEILKELSEKTGSKISAKLLGFGATGIEKSSYAGGFTLNSNLGSLDDLSALNDFCGAENIDLYFDFDLISLKNSSFGYNTFFDTAYSSLLKTATVYKYDAATRSRVAESAYNLLSRSLLNDGTKKLVKNISDWNLSGISLEDLTSVAYSDHSTETTEYFTKGKMSEDVVGIMDTLSEKYKIAAYDANAYAACAADVIYNTPNSSSKERIFTEDVPFYQMVFKGYVSMAGESMNMASNANTQLLKTVESGVGLNYTVIANYYNEFIDYRGYYFFGSLYSDIKDNMTSLYSELKDYYAAIEGEEIVSHTILESGLREVVYSNGVTAYVNYTDNNITAPSGSSVEARSYVWEK